MMTHCCCCSWYYENNMVVICIRVFSSAALGNALNCPKSTISKQSIKF
ncbi:hypothetical protein M8C21_022767, partial [Ambrosia artemisiifolia]